MFLGVVLLCVSKKNAIVCSLCFLISVIVLFVFFKHMLGVLVAAPLIPGEGFKGRPPQNRTATKNTKFLHLENS